jgi:hypothetical protein
LRRDTKQTSDGNGSLPRHLEDADLISYLDGELERAEHEYVRTHLEGCWNCRSALLAVQNSIESFLRARKQIMPDEIPPSTAATAQFRRRLAQHRSAPVTLRLHLGPWLRSLIPSPSGRGLGRGSSVTRSREPKPFSPWKGLFHVLSLVGTYKKTALATGLVALVLVALLIDPLGLNSVSADELLTKASAYEFLNETPKGKVVRLRARLDRINLATKAETPLGQIETDTDSSSSAVHVSVESASRGLRRQTFPDRDKPSADLFREDFKPETASYLKDHGWVPQVSVSLYQRLIAGRGLKGNDGATVTRRGGLYELRHPFANGHPSHITETVITLNEQTYAPQAVSMFTLEGNERFEYRLTRTLIEAVERTPEVAQLFDSSKPSATASQLETRNSKPETDAAEPETGNAKLETAVASADLEVEVLRLLHQAGADLGEQVSVTRTPGGPVRVSGIVDSDQRKSEILRALHTVAGNPAVRIEVKTVAEAMAERRDKRDTSRPATVEGVEVAADTFPAYQDLRARMSDEEARVFAARMVSRSHSAMRHAWALKRLMSQFSSSDLATLQPEAHAKWTALIQSHAHGFARETAGLRQQLEPIFSSGSGSAGAGEIRNDAELMRAVERLVALASTNYEIVRSAFTVTRESAAVSAIKTPQFWQSLRSAEALAARISRQ